MRRLAGCGLAGFDRAALVRDGNIDDRTREPLRGAARWARTAGCEGIVEKPEGDAWARAGAHALISMNCWRFGPSIFDAARRIERSPRGEFELADAVKAAMAAGERFTVVPVEAGVLDLSQRGDIPSVARRLAGVEVRL